MKLKRALSLTFGSLGILLSLSSLKSVQNITGAVTGTNVTSKFLGFFGIALIILAVVIDRYELEKHKK